MARQLPRLRRDLDLMPSPVEDRPGLLMRDPFRFSPSMLILPPQLVPCLMLFDGAHDESELRELLVRLSGALEVSPLIEHLCSALSVAGFLEDDAFFRMREERVREFAGQPERAAAHAGSAYPDAPDALRATLDQYLAADDGEPPARDGALLGIAAPHVSPEGGWRSYGAAYRRLAAGTGGDCTFVVLGTSHYGPPGRFGVTRKAFVTPLGTTRVEAAIVEPLIAAGGPAVLLEDYCHAVEHSIEFQVVFLQHLFGAGVCVVPILCGPLGSAACGEPPAHDPDVQVFLGALRGAVATRGDVRWVLGIDLAHVGRRYNDRSAAQVGDGALVHVERVDRERCALAAAGEADAFWETLEPADPLRWCGSSPLYAFLAAAGPVRGELLRYEQWNIDPQSVVSFAAMAFRR